MNASTLKGWTPLKLVMALVIALVSCTNLDDVNSRLDTLEEDVSTLKTAISSLQSAYNQNKLVSDVSALQSESGWAVTFSDGTVIKILNGVDGVTPRLLVDQDGYWTVSYDNGKTFTAILDANGNKICAVGKDGENGISVRIAVNSEGYYVVQTYKASDPDTTLSETVTPYTSDASRIISSIVQDDNSNKITLTLSNGQEFTFNMAYVSPTSIVILAINPAVNLSLNGDAEIEFRVNPSNAKFDYNVSGSTCEIELDKLGSVTRSSYVTAPTNYSLTKVEQAYDESGEMKVGQYKATITDYGTGSVYSEVAALVLNVKDGNGDYIQITSSPFEVTGDGLGGGAEQSESLATGLPIVYINTPNSVAITSKDDWTANVEMKILDYSNGKYTVDYEGTMSMKGRGNSTWSYPKKPYALKLDSKSKILGFPKHKRWVLLATWNDVSFMRTTIAFDMGAKSKLAYTPRIKDVELVLNGVPMGTYQLTEQLKIDEKRVNVGDDGFLMEIDAHGSESNGDVLFILEHVGNYIVIKDPDVVKNDDNYNYLVNYMTNFDNVLFSDNWLDAETGYKKYVDLSSFVDWYLVNEISKNFDAYFYSSCYMNLNRKTGILSMGPLWDFDVAFGNYVFDRASSTNNPEGFWLKSTIPWYIRMFDDPEFVKMVKERFDFFYSYKEYYTNLIEEKYTTLLPSVYNNNTIWHKTSSSDDYDAVKTNFKAACTTLEDFMAKRWEWLKAEYDKM